MSDELKTIRDCLERWVSWEQSMLHKAYPRNCSVVVEQCLETRQALDAVRELIAVDCDRHWRHDIKERDDAADHNPDVPRRSHP